MPPRHGGCPGAIPGDRTSLRHLRRRWLKPPTAASAKVGLISSPARLRLAGQFQNRLSVSTRPSLQNSAYSGQHGGNLPISVGAWQKSDAPALQAGSSRSVTGRPPPAFARCVSAGEGCRAGAHSAKAGFNVRMGRLWFGRPFHCGKLDQSTERSLINFYR